MHNLSHDSANATRQKITDRFIWPSMNADIKLWVKACSSCQKNKVTRHTKTPFGSFSLPDKRFEHIHIDLITMTECHGMKYCLTIIDRFTRWPQVIPIADMEALTTARALMSGWIAHYGVPLFITTDQGAQFESHLFRHLMSLLGSKRIRTTTYHPQANGQVENMHRWLKAAIKSHESSDWVDALPVVLLGIRSSFKPDIGATTAEMVYGTSLRLPGQFFTQITQDINASAFVQRLKATMDSLIPVPASLHNSSATFIHPDLVTCSHVWERVDRVRHPLQSPYEGPYPVLKRSDKSFVITKAGKDVTVSLDRLKPYFTCTFKTTHPPVTQSHTAEPETIVHTPTPIITSSNTRPKRSVRFNRDSDFVYY